MLKIGVTGRILSGRYEGWYVLIKPDGEIVIDGVKHRSYYIYESQNHDLSGSAPVTYNSLVPTWGSVTAVLEQHGAIVDGVVNIEWLEDD